MIFVLAYRDCFGNHSYADLGRSRRNLDAIVAYLRDHPVAVPLYILRVRSR